LNPITRALTLLVVLPAACAAGPITGEPTEAAPPVAAGLQEAVFAGGCFWCMESTLEQVPGVVEVVSGYIGGQVEGVSYRQIGSGSTGHAEAVRIIYNPEQINYQGLLDQFWVNIDPTQAGGQFCDRGTQYRSAIFPRDAEQQKMAEASLAQIDAQLGGKVVTTIEPWATFWVAEEYHQDYYKTHPDNYMRYRTGCGRDRRLKQLWGDKAPSVGH
jgi:peptide-methionine (S)-S-oxide reductase